MLLQFIRGLGEHSRLEFESVWVVEQNVTGELGSGETDTPSRYAFA